jgi:hypothetical protein
MAEQKTSIYAILSLILSALGIFGVWMILFSGIFCLLGLIFAIIARKQIAKNPNLKGKGIAKAGLIIGIIGTVIFLFFVAIFVFSALVLIWGKNEMKNAQEDLKDIQADLETEIACYTNITFDIKEIAGKEKICYRNEENILSIEYIMENKGLKRIEGFRIYVIGNDDSVKTTTSADLIENRFIERGMTIKETVSFEMVPSFMPPLQVEFIPYIKIDKLNKTIVCTKNSLVKTNIPIC